MRSRWRGYTLYELLMTMLVATTILAIGIPSFSSLLARQRQRVEIDALFHAIHVARKESIMRRRVVSLCPSSDGLTCSAGTDWSDGWIMFENADRDWPPRVDAGEPLLQRHDVSDSIRIVANRRGFTLRSTFLRATNGTFVICDRQGRVAPKGLVISFTGRPRVASNTPRGKPYSC